MYLGRYAHMTHISISKLKENPSKAIEWAAEYPVDIENRHEVKAYLIGNILYDKLLSYIENYIDISTTNSTDFSKGNVFEDVAKELGI